MARLYGAAARCRPAPTGPKAGVPGLYDYGIIGNLHTIALVSRFGGIDWACFPRLSSPSVFGRLLDPVRGGYQEIAPVEPAQTEQRYRPHTAILETEFRLTRDRRLVLRDFMPISSASRGEGDPAIVRMVEARGGTVDVVATFAPRFGYGTGRPEFSRHRDDAVVARWRDHRLTFRAPEQRPRVARGRATARLRLLPGAPVAFEMRWGEPPAAEPPAHFRLAVTERYWYDWVHSPRSPFERGTGLWSRWVERAELTLKLLTHQDSGAFVAAATTSLPEWPGGTRNWDYRYTWPRDASFQAIAMAMLEHPEESEAFLKWLVNLLPRRRRVGHLRVLYDAHGTFPPKEVALPELSGFADSRPVRIGNEAVEQFQLDVYGEALDAAALLSRFDPKFVRSAWPRLRELAQEVVEIWQRPDHGIWEMRRSPVHFVYSKVMAWVALDRAARIARESGDRRSYTEFRSEARRIRRAILERGYDADRKTFRMAYEIPAPDAAHLRIPLVGFLPFHDPRVVRTVERIGRELDEDGFIRRYRVPDGIDEPEGLFLPCSFWYVEVLARMGRTEEARERFRRLVEISSPLGLFSEEYDPRLRQPLGNYPQAFTHVAFLRASLAVMGQPPPTGPFGAKPFRRADRERPGGPSGSTGSGTPRRRTRARSRRPASTKRRGHRRASPRAQRRRPKPELER